jgi:hypothetical protein
LASQRSRQSRKRRNPGATPRAVVSTRREARAERAQVAERDNRRGSRVLGREGARPPSPFGGLPVSELLILIGIVTAVVGLVAGGKAPVAVGIVICALGVVEITSREHFSGFRSHTALLAGIPAIALEAVVVIVFGEPKQHLLLLAVVVPVFAVLFLLLRRKFLTARQARIAAQARPAPPNG